MKSFVCHQTIPLLYFVKFQSKSLRIHWNKYQIQFQYYIKFTIFVDFSCSPSDWTTNRRAFSKSLFWYCFLPKLFFIFGLCISMESVRVYILFEAEHMITRPESYWDIYYDKCYFKENFFEPCLHIEHRTHFTPIKWNRLIRRTLTAKFFLDNRLATKMALGIHRAWHNWC